MGISTYHSPGGRYGITVIERVQHPDACAQEGSVSLVRCVRGRLFRLGLIVGAVTIFVTLVVREPWLVTGHVRADELPHFLGLIAHGELITLFDWRYWLVLGAARRAGAAVPGTTGRGAPQRGRGPGPRVAAGRSAVPADRGAGVVRHPPRRAPAPPLGHHARRRARSSARPARWCSPWSSSTSSVGSAT